MRFSKKTIFSLCLLLTISLQGVAQNMAQQLQEGDLLFCISAQGNHITQVTQGVDDLAIDHVGMVHFCKDSVFVLEAIHQGVVLTPIDSFLVRRDSLVIATRLKDTIGVASSVQRALQYLGRPYDFMFMPSDDEFYCSELVQKNYLDADGQLICAVFIVGVSLAVHGNVISSWNRYNDRLCRRQVKLLVFFPEIKRHYLKFWLCLQRYALAVISARVYLIITPFPPAPG